MELAGGPHAQVCLTPLVARPLLAGVRSTCAVRGETGARASPAVSRVPAGRLATRTPFSGHRPHRERDPRLRGEPRYLRQGARFQTVPLACPIRGDERRRAI